MKSIRKVLVPFHVISRRCGVYSHQWSLVPREKNGHLKRCNFKIEFSDLICESDRSIGHVVMPLQFPATVLLLVKVLHL